MFTLTWKFNIVHHVYRALCNTVCTNYIVILKGTSNIQRVLKNFILPCFVFSDCLHFLFQFSGKEFECIDY